jgi:hypothetical protein
MANPGRARGAAERGGQAGEGDCVGGREKQTGGSGGSLEPPGPLLTRLHTVHTAYSECLPAHLNPWLRGPVSPLQGGWAGYRWRWQKTRPRCKSCSGATASLALDVEVILTPPCIFHQ